MSAAISDETFAQAMDKAMKAIKLPKAERTKRIEVFLLLDPNERDGMLDAAENMARCNRQKEVIPSEKAEQIGFVKKFRETYPGVVLFCARNDGFRTFAERPEQILMGVWPGVSDLLCLEFKMCIEMKKQKGGVQSDKQKEFQSYVEGIGWHYIIANGCEDGIDKVCALLNK